MTLCIRLAVSAALLVAMATGLVWLRTDTNQAGNHLHLLFSQKRQLEKQCCQLHLTIAALKNQDRLRERAVGLGQEGGGPDDEFPIAPPGATGQRPLLLIHGDEAVPP